jgi:hypothetical protein
MKIRLAILAPLFLPMMVSQADAACRCQCVNGTMMSMCDNAMMDMPVSCAPTACKMPTAKPQQPTAPGASSRCRDERVCDSYGTCRVERICN